LVREATNAHAEAAAARDASLQAKIKAVEEVKHVKEAMAHQVEKDMASLKRKLEVVEKKAKDATDDLQAVVEGKFAWSLNVEFMHLLGLSLIFRPWVGSGARETDGAWETWVPLGPHRPGSRPSPTSGSGLIEDPPTCQQVQLT
jgi:hypothetical protein